MADKIQFSVKRLARVIRKHDLETFKALLENPSSRKVQIYKSYDRYTPLTFCARCDFLAGIKWLAEQGLDVNEKDGSRNSAIGLALSHENKDMAAFLLPHVTSSHKLSSLVDSANKMGLPDFVAMFEARRAELGGNDAGGPERKSDVVGAAERTDDSEWQLQAEDIVSRKIELPNLYVSVTDIFNFTTRERLRLTKSSGGHYIGSETHFFDEFPDPSELRKAFNQLRALGGKAPEESIRPRNPSLVLDKPAKPQGA